MFDFFRYELHKEFNLKAREFNEICPHLVDYEILEGLYRHDKLNQTHLEKDYRSNCHEIELVYRPDIKTMTGKCSPCDFKCGTMCNHSYPKTAEWFLNKLSEMQEPLEESNEISAPRSQILC